MSMIRFYGYDKCSTCRDAKQHLTRLGVAFDDIDIVTRPPAKSVLAAILKSGAYTLPQLFNRSGELYRQMKLKDKLKSMTDADALKLLSQHGKLIKRPIVTDGKRSTVGYNPERFAEVWGAPSR